MLQVEQNGDQLALAEETHRDGIMAGSALLNLKLEQKVREVVTPAAYASWKSCHPGDAVKLVYDRLELQKRSFDGTDDIRLDLPLSLVRAMTPEVSFADRMRCAAPLPLMRRVLLRHLLQAQCSLMPFHIVT